MGDAEAGGRRAPSTSPAAQSIEGNLLSCCPSDLQADLLVVGHHGSKTSSRTQLLDAVGAHQFIVSSGPQKYGSVVLPDDEVIDELGQRGTVWRTDVDDDACATSPAKIGPDNDRKAGGCNHVRALISAVGLEVEAWHEPD
jgi:hypothetical protein